jgi:hypothetical protein
MVAVLGQEAFKFLPCPGSDERIAVEHGRPQQESRYRPHSPMAINGLHVQRGEWDHIGPTGLVGPWRGPESKWARIDLASQALVERATDSQGSTDHPAASSIELTSCSTWPPSACS